VFSAIRDDTRSLYILDLRSGREHRLTTDLGSDQAPSWSPDGKWIAFVAFRKGSNVSDVWLAKPDGSDDHPLTKSTDGVLAVTWSSDSREIIYSKDAFWGHDHDLYTVSLADGHEVLLSGLDWPEDTPAEAA